MKDYNREIYEKAMFLGRFLLSLVFFLFIFGTSAQALVYNENYTDLYLDKQGWCAGLDIGFKVYNTTDYENRFEINKSQNDDIYIRNISSADVVIYNGPLDILPVLIETSTNKTGEFVVNFPTVNTYLLQIFPEDSYNEYEEVISIEECEFANTDEENETEDFEEILESVEEDEEILLDKSFTYANNKITLNVQETEIAEASQVTVLELSLEELKAKEITLPDNVIASLEFIGDPAFNNLEVIYDLENIANVDKVYKYDSDSEAWEEIQVTKGQEDIIFESEEFGLFSITGFEPLVEEPAVIVEESTSEETETPVVTRPVVPQQNSVTDLIPTALGGIVIILILGGGMFLAYNQFVKKKKHEDPLEEETPKRSPEEEQKLTTYKEITDKTRAYIDQYKEKYSKDQIYRALSEAHVPKDIIDKVFLEKYH